MNVLPVEYGREHLPAMRNRWNGELGQAVREFGNVIWPNTPLPALIGFSANSTGARENTTRGTSAVNLAQSFHEIGFYQVPAGPRAGPAPNPDPNTHDNAWGKIALGRIPVLSALVTQVLGHPATMEPEGWQTAIRDQAAVGLANYRMDGENCRRLIGEGLSGAMGSMQFFTVSVMAFGVGAQGAANIINRYASDLPRNDESFIFGLAAAIVRDHQNANDAHAKRVVRALQRLESSKQLAQSLGQDLAWYGPSFPELEQQITDVSNGVTPTGQLPQTIAELGSGHTGLIPLEPAMENSSPFWWTVPLAIAKGIQSFFK